MISVRHFKSEPISYGSDMAVPLSFLDPVENMSAGVLDRLTGRIELNVDGDSGGLDTAGYVVLQAVKKLLIQDHGGERINASGLAIHIFNHLDLGAKYKKFADIVKSASGATVVAYLDIPIELFRIANGHDFRWNYHDFVEGGEISVQWATSTGGYIGNVPGSGGSGRLKVNSGKIEFFARAVDEQTHTDKTRFLLKEHAITKIDQTFPTGDRDALLHSALPWVGPTDYLAGTTWDAQKNSSDALLYQSLTTRDDYLAHDQNYDSDDEQVAPGVSATATSAVSPIHEGYVVPFVNPRLGQPMSELPVLSAFDWKTDLAAGDLPTNPQMIVGSIINRKFGSALCGCKGKRPTGKPMFVDRNGALKETINRANLARKIPVTYR